MSELNRRSIELKELSEAADGDPGGFIGYPSRFYDLDSYGDIVMPGAFAKSIPAFLERGFTAHSHDWGYEGVIGYPVEAREDETGLYSETKFHSTPDAQMVRTKVKERIEAGKGVYLSIGFYTGRQLWVSAEDFDDVLPTYLAGMEPEAMSALMERCREFPGVRLLFEIDLYEYSIVTAPALRSAEVTEVRSDAPESRETVPGAVTFEDELKAALGAAQAIESAANRAREVHGLRVKKGAAISAARRETLQQALDALEPAVAILKSVLDETAPKQEEGKSAIDLLLEQELRFAETRTRLTCAAVGV